MPRVPPRRSLLHFEVELEIPDRPVMRAIHSPRIEADEIRVRFTVHGAPLGTLLATPMGCRALGEVFAAVLRSEAESLAKGGGQ